MIIQNLESNGSRIQSRIRRGRFRVPDYHSLVRSIA
jgi:hypothetical protein